SNMRLDGGVPMTEGESSPSRSCCRHARPHLPHCAVRSATAAASGGCPAAAGYWAIKPPSITSSAPVTNELDRFFDAAQRRQRDLAVALAGGIPSSVFRNSRRDRVHRRTPRLSFPCKFSCHNRTIIKCKAKSSKNREILSSNAWRHV